MTQYKTFLIWMKETHPDITLSEFQTSLTKVMYTFGRGSGVSFVVSLWQEFDMALNDGYEAEELQ